MGKHLVLADRRIENANAAAQTLSNAGYDVSVIAADISSRSDLRAVVAQATAKGDVTAAYWYGDIAEVRT